MAAAERRDDTAAALSPGLHSSVPWGSLQSPISLLLLRLRVKGCSKMLKQGKTKLDLDVLQNLVLFIY